MLLVLFTHWSVNVKCAVAFRASANVQRATHCKVGVVAPNALPLLAVVLGSHVHTRQQAAATLCQVGELRRPCLPQTALREACAEQVTPADFTGRKEVVPLQRRSGERGEQELSFEFRKQRFCYDAQEDAFHKLKYPVQARLLRSVPWLTLRGPACRHRR